MKSRTATGTGTMPPLFFRKRALMTPRAQISPQLDEAVARGWLTIDGDRVQRVEIPYEGSHISALYFPAEGLQPGVVQRQRADDAVAAVAGHHQLDLVAARGRRRR